MLWCYSVITAAVPVHVDTIPPLAVSTEHITITELQKVNGIVDRLKDTSPAVISLMRQLKPDLSSFERTVIQDQLKQQFEDALYRGGVPPGMVTGLALMWAHNAVKDIQIVISEHGDSIVAYFLCMTVKSIYELGQMIMSGFMHAVFAAVIESLSCTTVDVNVYVRADEFNVRLLCLSKPQDKGWSIAVW